MNAHQPIHLAHAVEDGRSLEVESEMTVIDQTWRTTLGETRSKPRSVPSWTRFYIWSAFGADFLSALAGAAIALILGFPPGPGGSPVAYPLLSSLLPFAWVLVLAIGRAYDPRLIGVGSEEFRRILQVGFTCTAAIAIVAHATATDLTRGLVVVALPLTVALNLVARYWLRKQVHRLRRDGRCMRRVTAIGHRGALTDLIRQLRRDSHHGLEVVAVCMPGHGADDVGGDVEGVPVEGDLSETALVVNSVGADTVAVLACPEMDGVALRRLAWQLETNRIDLVVAPALMDVAGPRTSIRPAAGLPLLQVEHAELSGGRQLVKSMVDRTAALFALVMLAPLFAVIAIAVRATDPGPALFRQTRVGKGGREFTLLKFRTMTTDAEARKAELLGRNEHDGVLFKIRNDPRITRIGARLRRYSLDELPQLINVLRGDMSLVGPRPPLPEEVARYGYDVRRRLVVRPGMTGLWQVSGRSELSWEESVRLDLRYVENWSLMLDLQILWKTRAAVTGGSGAY